MKNKTEIIAILRAKINTMFLIDIHEKIDILIPIPIHVTYSGRRQAAWIRMRITTKHRRLSSL